MEYDEYFMIRLVVAGLAVYRLSELITIDYGPFHIFERMRDKLGRMAAANHNKGLWYQMAELLHCKYCTGIWLASAACFFVFIPCVASDIVLTAFAIAGIQSAFSGVAERGE